MSYNLNYIPGSSKCVKFLPFGRFFRWKGTNFTHLEDPGIFHISFYFIDDPYVFFNHPKNKTTNPGPEEIPPKKWGANDVSYFPFDELVEALVLALSCLGCMSQGSLNFSWTERVVGAKMDWKSRWLIHFWNGWCWFFFRMLCLLRIPSLKQTACAWKWMVGRWSFPLGRLPCRGELLVSGRVPILGESNNTNLWQFWEISRKYCMKFGFLCHKIRPQMSDWCKDSAKNGGPFISCSVNLWIYVGLVYLTFIFYEYILIKPYI